MSVQAQGKLCEGSRPNLQGRLWKTIICKSPTNDTSGKVFRNLRQWFNLLESELMLDQNTSVLIWRLFMSTTMKASVYLGPNYNKNLVMHRKTNFEELLMLSHITQMLILNHGFEILNLSTIEWTLFPWMRSALLHDKGIK